MPILTAGFLATSTFDETINVHNPENIQKYEISVADGDPEGIIDIQGTITRSTAAMVHEAFEKFSEAGIKSVVIHLNSLGGEVPSGAGIALDMKQAEEAGIKVGTYVDHKEICASMCTGIFAVGSWRAAAPDSVWVFHSPYFHLTVSQTFNPVLIKELVKGKDLSRKALMAMYSLADPVWAKSELSKYVYDDHGKQLILSGAQIMDHSVWFIDHYIEY